MSFSCSYTLLSVAYKFLETTLSLSKISRKIRNDWCLYRRYSRKMRALCSIHEAYWERSGGCYILDLIHIHDNTLDYCVNDVHEVSDSRHYSTFYHHHASHRQEIPRSCLVLSSANQLSEPLEPFSTRKRGLLMQATIRESD
jgi:hypothetical protein